MTGVEGLGIAASATFAQPLQSTFRASALRSSSAGEEAGRRNDDEQTSKIEGEAVRTGCCLVRLAPDADAIARSACDTERTCRA